MKFILSKSLEIWVIYRVFGFFSFVDIGPYMRVTQELQF